MFCPEDQRDRDKAAEVYARAINAQPGANVNAVLANRIAQLYGFYADPEKGIEPDRKLAQLVVALP